MDFVDLVKDIGKTLLEPELITKSVYDDNVVLFYRYYEHIRRQEYVRCCSIR